VNPTTGRGVPQVLFGRAPDIPRSSRTLYRWLGLKNRRSGDTGGMDFEEPQDLGALRKARSLLLILLATCQETLLALEAAANVLDTAMTSDLRAMIARSENELRVLNEKIAALEEA
jgi:hypothetical protein